MNYEEAVSYIADVPKFTKKNKPENTAELLARLGHPEEQYKIIHVAGTNGKGSVCAFTASILQEAGFRTGRNTMGMEMEARMASNRLPEVNFTSCPFRMSVAKAA